MTNSVKNKGVVPKITNFMIVNRVYSSGMAAKFDLNPTSLLVLIGLANHFNPEKNIVFPSQEYLAKNLNISERSVVRAVKELLAKNLIFKTKNKLNNIYSFTKIFFESVDLSGSGCQNVVQSGDKMSCKHDKYNNKNNVVRFEKFGNDVKGVNYPSCNDTKKLIEAKQSVKRGSPLDMEYEDAIKFLDSLLPELRESYFARELRKKWKIEQ